MQRFFLSLNHKYPNYFPYGKNIKRQIKIQIKKPLNKGFLCLNLLTFRI